MYSEDIKLDYSEIIKSINRYMYLLQAEEKSLEYDSRRYEKAVENEEYSEEELLRWYKKINRRLDLHECLKNILNKPIELINAKILSSFFDAYAEHKKISRFSEIELLITVENKLIESVFFL